MKNHRNNSSNLKDFNQQHNLSITDRIARLVLVTTVFGVLFGWALNSYSQFFRFVFSSTIYLEAPIRQQHIVIACVGACLVGIIIKVFIYIIYEFKSLDIQKNESIRNTDQMNNANKKYSEVLYDTVLYIAIAGLIMGIYTLIQFIYFGNKIVIAAAFIFCTIIFLSIIIYLFRKKPSINEILRIIKRVLKKIPYKQLGIITLLTIFITLFGILFMEPKQVIRINFEGPKLTISSEYKLPENIKITIGHKNGEAINILKELTIDENDFQKSFQEEVASSDNNDSFMQSLVATKPKNEKFLEMRNTHYSYKYKFDYEKYMKTGDNYVVITFDKISLNNTESKIVNSVIYKNGKFDVQESEFVFK